MILDTNFVDSQELLTEKEIIGESYTQNQLRPLALDQFQGQAEIKENLRVFIQAAKQREECLDHIFLSGPPGLGKTTLACILAQEMGFELKVTSAPALEKPKDLAGLLTSLNPNTIFFIDEIHRLKPALEEMLYVAMEDFEIDWIIGQGASARSIRVPVSPFTLVGATTRPGAVAAPLYSRFGIDLRMDLYDNSEILDILHRSAIILDIPMENNAGVLLSGCCRGTPRIANRLLRRMRDFAQVEGEGVITTAVVKNALIRLKIDSLGLGEHDRKILAAIIQNYAGGPVGAETLAICVGEATDSLEDFYEPYLIRKGLLQRTARGRMATDFAYEHLKMEKVTKNETNGLLF